MKKQRENSAPLKSDEVSSKPSGCEFEPYESLTLKDNFIFTKVMSDPANCRGFLLRAFPDLDIGKVTAVQESTHQTAYGSKGVRFDVYASDGSKIFDLEMQIVDKKDLPQRARYYNLHNRLRPAREGRRLPCAEKGVHHLHLHFPTSIRESSQIHLQAIRIRGQGHSPERWNRIDFLHHQRYCR